MTQPRSRAFIAVVAGLLATMVLTACGSATASGDAGFVAGDGSLVLLDEQARSPAPTWEGELLGGGTWRSTDTLGDVLVINVWASWCAPCRAEAPVLEEIWQEFKDQGVQFVGLDTRDTEASALAFIERYGITYPNVIDTDGRLQLLFSDTLPPQAIPSTLVIDREGRVAGRALGKVSASSLRGLIEPLVSPVSPVSP